jgi:ribosomal protein L40E
MIGVFDAMDPVIDIAEIENTSQEKNPPTADIGDIRSKIRFLENEIAVMKNKVGEHYLRVYIETGYCEQGLREIFEDITARKDEISSMEMDIQIAEDGGGQLIQPPVALYLDHVVCHSCGAVNDEGSQYCSSCGIRIAEDFTAEYNVEDFGICPLCGASLMEDAIFCYTCGAQVKI